jgi:hypothetical protein
MLSPTNDCRRVVATFNVGDNPQPFVCVEQFVLPSTNTPTPAQMAELAGAIGSHHQHESRRR